MDDIGAQLRRHHDRAVPPTTADEAIRRASPTEPPHRRRRVLAATAAAAAIVVLGTFLYAARDRSEPVDVSTGETSTTAPPTNEPPRFPMLVASTPAQPSLDLVELGGDPRRQVTVDDPQLAGLAGATAASDGRLAVWAGSTVWWWSTSGERRADIDTGPGVPGVAVTLRAVFSPEPDGLWVVHPGSDFFDPIRPTAVWWVDTSTGDVRPVSTDLPPGLFPIGTLSTGDVVLRDVGVDPRVSSDVVILTSQGNAASHVGYPLAVAGDSVVVQRCNETDCQLVAIDPSAQTETTLTESGDATFVGLGGPLIPGDYVPLTTASPSGRQVLVGRRANDSDVTSAVLVDLALGSVVDLGTLGTSGVQLAFFSCDGQSIAAAGRDGDVVATIDGTTIGGAAPTPFGLPADRWIVGLGSCTE